MTDETTPEGTTEPETLSDYAAAQAAREAHRLATRPNIDDLPDAVVKDELGRLVLVARPGDRIVVERYATILAGRPWLDTKTYTVQTIDEASGRVHLWDDELQRQALTDYIAGTAAGYRFKLPGKGRAVTNKRKRGRPRKNPAPPPAAPTTTASAAAAPPEVKRGRGRPKGIKNRPKDVIAAEKKAKATARKAKASKAAAVKAAKAKPSKAAPKATATAAKKKKPTRR